MDRTRLLFVCDYTSIHSRTYINYFLRRGKEFDVTVVSSRYATPAEGAKIVNLEDRPQSDRPRALATLFERVYPMLLRVKPVLNWVWARQLMAEIRLKLPRIRELARELDPQVIHAFRTQPEGVLARALADVHPRASFFLTTWGQDFVLFGESRADIRAVTRQVVQDTDVLLADNSRDARIAREHWGLPTRAPAHVMAATGGLDFRELEGYRLGEGELPRAGGGVSLLTMRGFESGYNRLYAVMGGHREFLELHPEAVLHIAVPRNPRRMALVEEYARKLGSAPQVRVFSPSRTELLQQMQRCDFNVFATETDGLSISLLESLYFGQFPVVFRHECYTPPLTDGVNCSMFSDASAPAIAAALERAVAIAPLRSARTASAQEMLRASYDRDTNLARIAEMYRNAVQLHAADPRNS